MTTRTLALSAALILALSGAAFAQTPAGGGSAEGNMNNPGSVKSNTQKAMGGQTGMAGKRRAARSHRQSRRSRM